MRSWRNAPTPTASTAGVLRPDEFGRHVSLQRHECAPDLVPWVENHWTLRWALPAETSYRSSVLPHPACTLSVERGHRRAEAVAHPVVVTGVVTRRFDVDVRDRGWVHGVKFRPGGLTSLTGVPGRRLRDVTVAASTVFPRRTVDALDRLGPGHAEEECRRVIEAELRGLKSEPEESYATVLDVIATMLGDRSLTRVAEVERRCGLSTRSLQRLFGHYLGVSPKWVLSRYRMHDVVAALDAGYDGSLADLAAEYGWFDQAHFTREFTALIGVPPGRYAARG